ncbi:argininosuccinate lyase, chloroplastic-like [Bidens hawaiensis]|uniref:argininosuccinate lyase, chloroplastic-like n=1 Tax=Bidens hawaiensis TaxID=980011 RepID=UPI00404B44EE
MESMLFPLSQSSAAVFSTQNPNNNNNNNNLTPLNRLQLFHHSIIISRSPRLLTCSALQPPMAKEAKLWGGRFEEGVTDAVERFTESISFDKALYKHDIHGSRAHASMLANQGLMTESDRDSIIDGLNEIEKRIERGEFVWRTDREDVHMNIEATLTDLIGDPAKKLHTARSRNDQVSTDFRLWCRDAIDTIVSQIKQLQIGLVRLAKKNIGVVVPGFTHLQSAEPVLLQQHLLAYVEQLEFDARRLLDCRARLNFCPLGACALAGTGLPINRFMTSEALGFTAPMRNSMDAVSDRDFILELLSGNAILALHLSWLGEEWGLWASDESGFGLEGVCGMSARVLGDLVTLQVLCKGLPLTYNRDLQEDKEPVFDSVKTVIGMLKMSTDFSQNITYNQEKTQKGLPSGLVDHGSVVDRDGVLEGLDQIQKQIESGEFVLVQNEESAKNLLTAGGQNGQLSTDFCAWCSDAIDKIASYVKHLQVSLVRLAKKNTGVIVPGYTHLQRAQPVLLQHHLLAYVEQLERDAERLQDCRARLDTMKNSTEQVASDLAFVLEFASANSITAIHLSRLGEEWVLWASEEFGFITPSDSVSTGSSIMPQKKNPDPMELVRGKSARVVGDLVKLQLAHNHGLQVDKEPIADSVKTIIGMLEVSAEFALNMTYNQDRIQNSLPAGHLDATTLADYLVHKGIPFRTSHDIVGRAVALCVYKKCQLRDLTLDELHTINTVFDEGVYDYLGVENSIKKFSSYGSTGSECVAAQLDFWVSKLGVDA